MKYQLIIVLFVFSPIFVTGQLTLDLKGVVEKNISSDLKKGLKVNLTEIAFDDYSGFYKANIFFNKSDKKWSIKVDLKKLKNISFAANNTKEFWQHQALRNGVYHNLVKKGMQYKMRKEVEEDALKYINYVKVNNLLFNDGYLESYLYSLAYKIYPSRIGDGRPGILNIKILKDTDPNAFVYPNGTMFLTTGLLSAISSEEELIGVMAHEISHFVLDHSIININKAEQRKKRAEFWANIATGATLAAELYTASKDEYYVPGAFTISTAIIAHTFAAQFNERMGLKFSREQEVAADICAKNLMTYIHIDPTSLSSVLSKIKTYNIKNGNYFALTGKGTHPSIDFRISNIGQPTSDFKSIDYDRTVSFVNSFNAIIEFNNHHLEQCAKLVNRNRKANVATEEDYILLAMVTTYMFDNTEKNLEALSYINKAKGLNVYPDIKVYKQEAIIQIRLKQNQKAKLALNNYLESLDKQYLGHTEYIIKEKEWTLKMINKVSKM